MIKMDFKGIMWIGNVFQKFEAMCLEVEEVVCEDTVKYVENQAQTVGASMKKFYSDVMQDVLTPSSIDPVKLAAADLSLNLYTDFSIHKKPKVSTQKDNVADHKRESVDLKIKDETNEYCSSELFLEQNKNMSSDEKSRAVIKRISQKENNLTSEVPRSSSFLSKDLNRVSKYCEMDKNYDVATNQSYTVISTNKRSESSHVEDFVNVTSVVSTADMILPSESEAKREKLLRDTSSRGPPDESSAGINGACGTDEINTTMGSYVSCNPRNSESASEDSSPTGDAKVSFFVSDEDLAEPAEAIQKFDKFNCVVVGREDLLVAASKDHKPKSYKKKIRKAFLSKRSARKQEYKQLAVQHGSLGTGSNQELAKSLMPEILDKEKSPHHRISESEWELL